MEQTEVFSREAQRSLPAWLLIACAALLAMRIGSYFVRAGSSEASPIHWVSLDRAVAQSRQLHRPILYDFSAAWCGPCRHMESEVSSNAALVAKINSRVVPVHVVDRQQEDGMNPPPVAALQSRFGVRAFPTLVLAGADGRELKRMEGYRGRRAFEDLIP